MIENNIEYRKLASIILKEINKIRKNPSYMTTYLQKRLQQYEENTNLSYETHEGRTPLLSLIEELDTKPMCIALNWSFELHQAADQRARALGSQTINSEVAQMDLEDLVSQFTDYKGHLAEQVVCGLIDPRELLSELLIDDGHPQRENRKQFFNHLSNYIGIGIHIHDQYQFVVVLIYAYHVERKKSEIIVSENATSQCNCILI